MRDVERMTFEVGMLGRAGSDVNDPARRYTLRSLPGERSGLDLVCTMYAGMKTIAPEAHAGFDLAADFALSVPLSEGGDGLMSPAQRVRPAHDRRELPGLHELLQDEQVLPPRASSSSRRLCSRCSRRSGSACARSARGGRTCSS